MLLWFSFEKWFQTKKLQKTLLLKHSKFLYTRRHRELPLQAICFWTFGRYVLPARKCTNLPYRENSPSYGRFVSLKLEDRRVVIGVDSVVGLINLDSTQLGELPPLLKDLDANLIESFGSRDAQLLLVLRAARIVPEEVWTTLAESEAVP
jgi:hypothetical protein